MNLSQWIIRNIRAAFSIPGQALPCVPLGSHSRCCKASLINLCRPIRNAPKVFLGTPCPFSLTILVTFVRNVLLFSMHLHQIFHLLRPTFTSTPAIFILQHNSHHHSSTAITLAVLGAFIMPSVRIPSKAQSPVKSYRSHPRR